MTRRVITERDVRRAASESRNVILTGGAMVTPGARELARQLGIELSTETPPPDPEPAPERAITAPHLVPPSAERAARATARGEGPSPSLARHGDAGAAAPSVIAPHVGAAPTVAFGADHGGGPLRDAVTARLREHGAQVTDVSALGAVLVDYADLAAAVAGEVAARRAQFGIMVDGMGVGSCMVANKVGGVRAAMCHDVTTAVSAREFFDANVLTLAGGLIGPRLAVAIVDAFLSTPFAGARHAPHVAKIDALGYGG